MKEVVTSMNQENIQRVRVAVCESVRAGATVGIVSEGDNRLLDIEKRNAWHFPRTDEGGHRGWHPADDAEAIALLEDERTHGLSYIAFPGSALWWLEYYKGFAAHLNTHYQALRHDHVCALYKLDQRPTTDRERQLQELLANRKPGARTPHELFGSVDDKFWFWLNTEGCRINAQVASALPTLPDSEVQARTIGSAGDHALLEGFNAYGLVKKLYERHRGPIGEASKILDFGCGWGRIIRFFLKDLSPEQVTACDSSEKLISTCRATNPWCEFVLNNVDPPCSLPSNSFDLIFLYSVFSHLSEDSQRAWRSEFHRLLRPGGLLITTTWHREFINWCSKLRQDPSTPCAPTWRKTLQEIFLEPERHLANYDSGEFVFAPYNRERSPWSYSGDVPRYGEACVSRQYVEKHWTDLFDLVEFIDDRAQCPQNVIVAQKKPQRMVEVSSPQPLPITVLTGLPGAGKSSWLIEMVNEAKRNGRPVLTFSCGDSPFLNVRDYVRVHRLLGCRRPGLVCPINHLVSTGEAVELLQSVAPETIVVFDEAYHFGKKISRAWADAAQRGVRLFIATPSSAQRLIFNQQNSTENHFTMKCQRCAEAEAITSHVVPGEDATLSLCLKCDTEMKAEVRAHLLARLQEQSPVPGEKTLYQPIAELEEYSHWRVLRPDSRTRAELLTRVIKEVGLLDEDWERIPMYLDIGCNTGYFCNHMHGLGFFAEGEDVVKGDIEAARILDSWFRNGSNRYVIKDAYDYLRDSQDRIFDVTSAFAVFQWVMIQTSLERGIQCLEWLFAKTRRICFLEMGYSSEAQYKEKLPGNIDRSWVFNIMEQKGGFSEIRMFDAKKNGLMFGSRDLFVGIKG